MPHTLISGLSGFSWLSLSHHSTQPSLALFMFILSWRKKTKTKTNHVIIFYMLFKPINIMSQRQFGKSLLWLEAHRGSAHLLRHLSSTKESVTWSQLTTVMSCPSPAPEHGGFLVAHSFISCHLSPSRFLFLIFNTFSELHLHNLFTCCDHQTKTRRTLKAEIWFPLPVHVSLIESGKLNMHWVWMNKFHIRMR